MSRSIKKLKKPRKPRDMITLAMLLSRHGGAMRDRRDRRSKDARRHREDMGEDE